MSLLEDRPQEIGEKQVANVCIANEVDGAELMTVWRALGSYCHGNLMG